MENPTKIEIEGLKTIHKLCKFGADHNMEGCSFAEIVERMFDELQQARKVAVSDGFVLINKESLAFHARSIRMFNSGEYCKEEIEEHVCSIEAMIEAQEQVG